MAVLSMHGFRLLATLGSMAHYTIWQVGLDGPVDQRGIDYVILELHPWSRFGFATCLIPKMLFNGSYAIGCFLRYKIGSCVFSKN